jgi:3-oxoadipate CoA-transferase beta subunit
MDLAAGARQVYVVMELFTKNGESKIVENCTYPLTGTGCVDRVYSDYAIFEFAEGAIRVLEIFDPIEIEELSTLLNLELIDFRK